MYGSLYEKMFRLVILNVYIYIYLWWLFDNLAWQLDLHSDERLIHLNREFVFVFKLDFSLSPLYHTDVSIWISGDLESYLPR